MKLFLILLLFNSSSTNAQSAMWELRASKISLPSGNRESQQYSFNGSNTIISNYHWNYSVHRKKRMRPKRKHEQRHKKLDAENFQAYDFIQLHLNDSTYELSRSLVDLDSADLSYLKENDLLTDSTIHLNFGLFLRQSNKAVKTCDDCLPLMYFQGHQIDGSRLIIVVISDSMELFKMNVGINEMSQPNSFQQWIIFAEACQKFDLFDELNLTKSYFSRTQISGEVARYVHMLKR